MSQQEQSTTEGERPRSLVGGKYKLVRKLGCGGFGVVYLAKSVINGEEVAVKLEKAQENRSQLKYESNLYKILQGAVGFPTARWFGQVKEYNVLVLDVLGPSLESLFNSCSRRFSLKTVLIMADQMLGRLEYLHSKGFIHRDIKPENILVGLPPYDNMLYLIDFGLAKRFQDPRTGLHVPNCEDRTLTGTPCFVSLNVHNGQEQSRRDDLESLGFMFVYFNRGRLPWEGISASTKKQRNEKINEVKMATSVEALCMGLPIEFRMYMNYCRSLEFDQVPDYRYLRNLFRTLYGILYYPNDAAFDWVIKRKLEEIAEMSGVTYKQAMSGMHVSL